MERASSAVFATVFLGIFLSLVPHASDPIYVFALGGTGCAMLAFLSRAIWPYWSLWPHRGEPQEKRQLPIART